METAFLKGLAVLETLALSGKPRGVSDLAVELKMTKSNVHRVLQALVQRGFATKDSDSGRYKLTLKMWELGAHILSRIDFKEVAGQHLRDLAEQTEESVHLSVLDGASVIYIDKIDSPQPVRAYSRIGGRAPSYCVATGKALLAYQPAEVIERAAADMKKFTPRTLRNLKELKQDLERVRHLGYAINRGEWRDGVCGIAAPIRDSSGSVVAAVGLSGPSARMNAGAMRDFGVIVTRAAAVISRNLGASKPLPPSNSGSASTTRRRSPQQTKRNARMIAL